MKARYLRLKAIQFVSFQKSDMTIWREWQKNKHYQGDLRRGETYLFVSLMGDKLMFVMGEHLINGKHCLDTRRLRLEERSPWSPNMLQEYAKRVSLTLQGFATLEEQLDDRREKRLEAERIAREARRDDDVRPRARHEATQSAVTH